MSWKLLETSDRLRGDGTGWMIVLGIMDTGMPAGNFLGGVVVVTGEMEIALLDGKEGIPKGVEIF